MAIALISLEANAKDKEATVNFGSGVFNSGQNSLAETKVLTLGINTFFYDRRLFYRYEIGAYIDTAGNGRQSSALGGALIGINVENSIFYAHGAFGFNIITNPDTYLGGPFEFTEEVNLGLTDSRFTKLGFFYKHISSAGLYTPNVGRDFVGVKIHLPF